MICRVKIPTVIGPNDEETVPEASVHVAFDDDTYSLSLAQAAGVAEWLEWADRLYDRETAGEMAATLRRALELLNERPPRLVPERYVGLVEGRRASGETAYLDLSVDTAVVELSHPRIVLRGGESLERFMDTWWLFGGEARRLAELCGTRTNGALTELGPNERPFLHVRAVGEGVELRFDDELAHIVMILDGPSSDRLVVLLAEAVALLAEPPYVYVEPEPRDVLVAELRWP